MEFLTWKQLRESLPEGIDGEAAEFIRRQTASERHIARTRQAARLALLKANEVLSGTHNAVSYDDIDFIVEKQAWHHTYGDRHLAPAHALVASVLCQIEVTGTGGPGGMGGNDRATVRADWAQALGKGRALASDGPAWTAAIEAAGHFLRGTVTDACEQKLYDIPDELDEASILIMIGSPQALSAARVRLAEKLYTWLGGRAPEAGKDLAEWSATVNELERLCRSPRGAGGAKTEAP